MKSTADNPEKNQWKRSPCPIACTLDLLGDKWTLIVVRDLLMGRSTYSDFQNGPENIPTNILAERLKRLEHAEVLTREQYQQRPPRYSYHLTPKGKDLAPILKAMARWSNDYLPYTVKV
ncbi:MAG: helix-turn-helix transcriptional regulator [Motiliproteus sp.]|nr:helix-turn-helix transcriptional regulator [Motiliproteus sp.]